jgi:hypothetical protein
VLQYFQPETITAQLQRGQAGAYVDGRWVLSLAAAEDIRIIAPQPLVSNDLQMLQDGEHIRDYLTTWTKTRVMTREGGEDADRILFDGDTYKVMQVDDRSLLGRFYRVVMRRVEPGTT